MSLEGNLRDLELQEVFQLLAHSRKSGDLRITAQLAGLSALVSFDRGAVVNASIEPLTRSAESPNNARPVSKLQVESTALELLAWRDGAFKFVPRDATAEVPDTGVRLHTELILVEGARHLETWARLADRIPNARAVPAFVSVEPKNLPLLHLVPQQWEVLTRVDGQRDLVALSEALGRELLDVAEIVYGLIETGLLSLVDNARATRTHATPPSTEVTPGDIEKAGHVWVPTAPEGHSAVIATGSHGYDAVFDPVRVGVITPDGLPRLERRATPARAERAGAGPTLREVVQNDVDHRAMGDAAALRGDYPEALTQWSEYLKRNEHGADADHAREAIALVARLHALLHPAWRN